MQRSRGLRSQRYRLRTARRALRSTQRRKSMSRMCMARSPPTINWGNTSTLLSSAIQGTPLSPFQMSRASKVCHPEISTADGLLMADFACSNNVHDHIYLVFYRMAEQDVLLLDIAAAISTSYTGARRRKLLLSTRSRAIGVLSDDPLRQTPI